MIEMCTRAVGYFVVGPPGITDLPTSSPGNTATYVDSLSHLQVIVRSFFFRNQCQGSIDCPYCGRLGRLPFCEIILPELGDFVSELGLLGTDVPGIQRAWEAEPICVTMKLAKHYRGNICVCYTSLHILAFGYPEAELLDAILNKTLRLTITASIPKSMQRALWLQKLTILELVGENKSDESINSYEDRMDIASDPMGGCGNEQALFNASELQCLVSALTATTSLQILSLKACSFENLPFDRLFEALTYNRSLIDVSMEDCDFINSRALPSRAPESNAKKPNMLVELSLKECAINDQALCSLCVLLTNSKLIQRVSLIKNDWAENAPRDISNILLGRTSLQVLDLSGFDGGLDAVKAIGKLLEHQKCRIRKLNLSQNPQPMDLTNLAHALRTNKHLAELDLSANVLVGLGLLAIALHENDSVETMNLSNTSLDDDSDDEGDGGGGDTVSFFAGLYRTKRLRVLDLSSMAFTPTSLQELACSLRQNKSLHTLLMNNLDLEDISSLGVLLDAMEHNQTLTCLEIGRNKIEEGSMKRLVSSLVVNSTLEALTMSGCDLTDDLVTLLGTRLGDIKGIRDLDLSFNQFGKDGAAALLHGLKNNRSISTLAVYNSCWSIGGPTVFECHLYKQEDEHMQTLVKLNQLLGWPKRFEAINNDATAVYALIRGEIVPSRHGK